MSSYRAELLHESMPRRRARKLTLNSHFERKVKPMTPPKAWIQLASNSMCKAVMVATGSMCAETDEILAANVREMRKTTLSVLDMLASAAAELERRGEEESSEDLRLRGNS
jgi:hypothetical protein